MTVITAYNVGNINLEQGSNIVTGVGVAWTGAGIREGDLLWHKGLTVRIEEYVDNTTIKIAYPWFGESATEADYEIRYTPDSERVLNYSMQVLQAINNDALSSMASLKPKANEMVYYRGLNQASLTTITSVAREFLKQGSIENMRQMLGITD